MEDSSSELGPEEILVPHRGRSLRLYLPSRETDHVQKGIADRSRFYESDMLGHMEAMLRPDDLVVDVGAYIGSHVVYLAGGCDARVVAFEPNPDSFAVLERNVEINSLEERVELHRVGVGRERGKAALLPPPSDNLGSSALVQDGEGDIEIVPLDSLELPGAVRIVKIDVEGMERDVIAGAAETIQAHRPLVYLEVRNKAALAGALEAMRGWGYSATAQFNATPTILMVPEEDVLAVLNAQLAFARHAMHTDLAAHGERLKRQLANQDAHAAQLRELQSSVSAAATNARIDELERHLREDGAASKERAEQQTAAVESMRQGLEQRAARGAERIAELGAKVVRLYEEVVQVDERVADAVERMETRSAEQVDALQETREELRAVRRTADRQSKQLGRVEAELYSLKQRLASSTAPRAGVAAGSGREPRSVDAASRRGSSLGTVGRKYRKLRRDPKRFFEDARWPWVGSIFGRAYPSGRRGR